MKTKIKKKKEEMLLELDGKISLVSKKDGRVTKREELDGKTMLEALRYMIEQALDNALAR